VVSCVLMPAPAWLAKTLKELDILVGGLFGLIGFPIVIVLFLLWVIGAL